ncbi:MAG TPA: hypothetical protein VNO81_10625 [Candidatus Nitrosotenuis sp.]|jgi:hypothetical protein|nr:hypothetical protein [Candidatus Nitrosotenuis sp.]
MAVRAVKEKVNVILLTTTFRLEGEMHVVPGGRLLDEINKERDFIPLTNATVYDPSGTPLDTLDFIAVNKNLVVMVAPSVAT